MHVVFAPYLLSCQLRSNLQEREKLSLHFHHPICFFFKKKKKTIHPCFQCTHRRSPLISYGIQLFATQRIHGVSPESTAKRGVTPEVAIHSPTYIIQRELPQTVNSLQISFHSVFHSLPLFHTGLDAPIDDGGGYICPLTTTTHNHIRQSPRGKTTNRVSTSRFVCVRPFTLPFLSNELSLGLGAPALRPPL